MTLADEVIEEIIYEWAENWDMVIEFFGQEIADKLDQAYLESKLE